jgi:YD repeat-containing protein
VTTTILATAKGTSPSLEREPWPLVWTVELQAGKSPITIFDLVELRATVDTLRVAAGLEPVAWEGRSAEDPTFAAGRTPIRAGHFTQLREALAELYGATGLGSLPEFDAGPIGAGQRVIKLADPLNLRGWVEQYEAARPALAARVVRRYGASSAPGLGDEASRGRLTEVWDGAGHFSFWYNGAGQVVGTLRVLDRQDYWTRSGYDQEGRLAALTYPDGEQVSITYGRSGEVKGIEASQGSTLGELVGPPRSGEQVLSEVWERTGETAVKLDGRGRPILLGDPSRPGLRLAYAGDGTLAKRLDERGTVHLVGAHYERTLGYGEIAEQVTKFLPDGAGGGRWRLKSATTVVE